MLPNTNVFGLKAASFWLNHSQSCTLRQKASVAHSTLSSARRISVRVLHRPTVFYIEVKYKFCVTAPSQRNGTFAITQPITETFRTASAVKPNVPFPQAPLRRSRRRNSALSCYRYRRLRPPFAVSPERYPSRNVRDEMMPARARAPLFRPPHRAGGRASPGDLG